ncbi:hypothetical protein [Chitinilyticum aquatile]|uniref:hypothetical protein n=1 Tax=Chitinilyticum aquatile TaxID=362520 RepID=UPI000425DE6F|nr:hypothetical protein [Chitinilyticum aquatile]
MSAETPPLFWLQVAAHESVEQHIDRLAAHWRKQSGGYVSVQEGRAVLISNLRIWENLALPAWYHLGQDPAQLEPHLLRMLEPLGWDDERIQNFVASLPQALSAADRRLAQLMRGLLANPLLLMADADWWRQVSQKCELAQLLNACAPKLPILVVAHHEVPAGFRAYADEQEFAAALSADSLQGMKK